MPSKQRQSGGRVRATLRPAAGVEDAARNGSGSHSLENSGWQVIQVQKAAPGKPALGAPCNGCGVCCLAEPCPVGVLVSRRRHGACDALRWRDAEARYVCGAVSEPLSVLPEGLGWFAPLFARLARRWIAAGTGCDSTVEALRR